MPEAIRLVIWDLDETFWKGTVSEGGHTYHRPNHDIVIELAKRGIVSSICSKNDFATIKNILKAEGLWDYFVFPSISWEPKGPRIAALVEAVQLRAATVLFIDDNPMNLNEAKHYVPDIQIADENIIAELLSSPLCKGKQDPELTRLEQYKLLERKKDDQAKVEGDSRQFLRTSGIKVSIEHDVSEHLDRVIELINRTNQLNFTKLRLPEDRDTAANELSSLLSTYRMQVGLVRVTDNYGDYGYCGFYAYCTIHNAMIHFCFSCRTLGMMVEAWLYERLGRPPMYIQGEVLTDLRERHEIDWITYVDASGHQDVPLEPVFRHVYMRGGCDLAAVGHYLSLVSNEVTGEFHKMLGGLNIRTDHSVFLKYLTTGISPDQQRALSSIGYVPASLASSFDEAILDSDVFVFTFWTDANYALYRHKESRVLSPFIIASIDNLNGDVTAMTDIEFDASIPIEGNRGYAKSLRDTFERRGPISREEFIENIRVGFGRIDSAKPIVIMSALESYIKNGKTIFVEQHRELNKWLSDISAEFPNVVILNLTSCIEDNSEIFDHLHFHRKVYYRVHQEIVNSVKSFRSLHETYSSTHPLLKTTVEASSAGGVPYPV